MQLYGSSFPAAVLRRAPQNAPRNADTYWLALRLELLSLSLLCGA